MPYEVPSIANLEKNISFYAEQEIEKHMWYIVGLWRNQKISTPTMLEQLGALRDDIANQMPHFGRAAKSAYTQVINTLQDKYT